MHRIYRAIQIGQQKIVQQIKRFMNPVNDGIPIGDQQRILFRPKRIPDRAPAFAPFRALGPKGVNHKTRKYICVEVRIDLVDQIVDPLTEGLVVHGDRAYSFGHGYRTNMTPNRQDAEVELRRINMQFFPNARILCRPCVVVRPRMSCRGDVDICLSAFINAPDGLSIPIACMLGHIMAQKATIYKVELSVSDMDRHYYETHNLTVAKHPSETDERLMVRILAFALNAHERLEFSRGISTDDEPDVWQKSLSGELELWIALGLPSEKIVRQSSGKSDAVAIYCYGGKTADMWWDKLESRTTRFDNLQVVNFSETDTKSLAELASRSMRLQVNIQDGEIMVSVDESVVYVTPVTWKNAKR
jgi:uncharacterized protein YaeQ